MNKLNVVLLKLPTLYEILSEIKLELNFNLLKYDEFNKNLENLLTKNPQILVISAEKNKYFNNNILHDRPIKIKSLLQQINVYLSKSNFDANSAIYIGSYRVDTNSRLVIKDNLSLKLTEREVELLLYLNKSENENNRIDLQKNVWKHSSDLETHTVETHIYRLRKKIYDTFKDDNLIINTKKGYKLFK